MRLLLVLFVGVPLLELYLLVWLSTVVGFWTTVAITLVTGVVGGTLAKREGLRVWRAWNDAISRMVPPEEGVTDGVLVLVGGALLITPGVLTDVVGFALLLPASRRAVARQLRAWLDRRIASGQIGLGTPGVRMGVAPWPEGARTVIDTVGDSVNDR